MYPSYGTSPVRSAGTDCGASPETTGQTSADRATWSAIEALMRDRWRGGRLGRAGRSRYYRVPVGGGRFFVVEITMRTRWCAIAVDRVDTRDRPADLAGPWFEQHVSPAVRRALVNAPQSIGSVIPTGRAGYALAYPIDRVDLVDALTAWVDVEIVWSQPAAEAQRVGDV